MRESVNGDGAATSEGLTRSIHPPHRQQPQQTRTRHVGRTLKGRYRLETLLGIGAMGEVYRALDRELGQPCAVKLVQPGAMLGLQAHRRFTTEAAVISRLFHPNIVAVHDVGEDEDGTRFLVMELLVGRSLHEHLAEWGRLPLVETVSILSAVGAALQYAHDLGFVHRDVTPSNIFLLSEGEGPQRVKVLDFGLARMVGDGGSTPLEQLTRGIVVGTPSYLAPEATSMASHLLDARADQWSLGVLLYQMLTGRLPFTHPNPFTLCHLICTAEPTPLGVLAPGLPEHVYQTVATALSKQREARFERVSDLIRSLCNLPVLGTAGSAQERRDTGSLHGSVSSSGISQPTGSRCSPGQARTRRLQILDPDFSGAASQPQRTGEGDGGPWLYSDPLPQRGAGRPAVEPLSATIRYSAEQLRELGLNRGLEPDGVATAATCEPPEPARPEQPKQSAAPRMSAPQSALGVPQPAALPPLPVFSAPPATPPLQLKMPPPLFGSEQALPEGPPRQGPREVRLLRELLQSASLAMGLALALLLGLLLARYVSPAPIRTPRHAERLLLKNSDSFRTGTDRAPCVPNRGLSHAPAYAG